jgi:hypothetical protein
MKSCFYRTRRLLVFGGMDLRSPGGIQSISNWRSRSRSIHSRFSNRRLLEREAIESSRLSNWMQTSLPRRTHSSLDWARPIDLDFGRFKIQFQMIILDIAYITGGLL